VKGTASCSKKSCGFVAAKRRFYCATAGFKPFSKAVFHSWSLPTR
jgi:hypothetical protein